VLGIGNGFQILCELGVLPGALLRNKGAQFHSAVESVVWGSEEYFIPVACGWGQYYADQKTLSEMEANKQILLRYKRDGAICGVTNQTRTAIGLMPHPERAYSDLAPTRDGRRLLDRILAELKASQPK
jgi:phosphoribosylformylglycinamidine synthase